MLTPIVPKALRDYGITAPIDVHLMVKQVDRLIIDFVAAGADMFVAGSAIFGQPDYRAVIKQMRKALASNCN